MARPTQTLLDFLRIEMGLTGTKGACLEGECGSCYVLVDGKPMNSCLMLAPQVQDRNVTTIEGFARNNKLDVIQQKFVECGAVQCGYCTPGLIVAAKALLNVNPHPSREEFLVGMEGNICRCTGYSKILRACELAAEELGLKTTGSTTTGSTTTGSTTTGSTTTGRDACATTCATTCATKTTGRDACATGESKKKA